ncbi:MAG: type I-G CRISPR-associated helicase/endonuclease Cas3g [Bacilli bacterium]
MDWSDFPAYFESVHGAGQQPFPWQMRLVRGIVHSGRWPAWIDLPTTSGKSAAVDIAAFLLALSADGSIADMPRRVFFVVDRRIVVDSVHERATKICDCIEGAKSSLLSEMRERLLKLGGEHPLKAVVMRGGLDDRNEWATNPAQPLICTTTVDQLGSRMLFRGYGLSHGSRNMLSAHAGLTTHDALVILDEVHLSQPFSETLEAIQRFRSWSEEDALSNLPFQVVRMSATTGQEEVVFTLDAADREHPILGQRLKTAKRVRLLRIEGVSVKDLQGAERARVNRENRRVLARELSGQLAAILESRPECMVAGCIVNRVKTARDLVAAVRERLETAQVEGDVILLTGRQRGWDRRALLKNWLPFMRADAYRREVKRRLIVIATQCLEVGADVDFDVLVTESAPLDALRQRFGRLNRLGRSTSAMDPGICGAIVHLDTGERTVADRVYGSAAAATWKKLFGMSDSGKKKGKATQIPELEMGIESMDQRLAQLRADDLRDLTAPREHAPVMMPAYLDLWAQTNPRPTVEPSPELFLHGKRTNSGDVHVVWRADLLPGSEGQWKDIVSLYPPCHEEACPVPIWELRAFLNGQIDIDGADVETMEGDADGADEADGRLGRPCLRWRGARSEESEVISAEEIRPGDTLLLPTMYGGYRHDNLDLESPEPVQDIANAIVADLSCGNLRVHWQLLAPCVSDGADQDARESLRAQWVRHVTGIAQRKDAGESVGQDLDDLLGFLAREGLARAMFGDKWESILGQVRGCDIYAKAQDGEDTGFDDVAQWGIVLKRPGKPARGHLTDETEDTLYTDWILLEQHLDAVAERVSQYALAVQLPEVLQASLRLAGQWHDHGKVDHRFQSLLRLAGVSAAAVDNSSEAGALPEPSKLLAKARPFASRHSYVEARAAVGLPEKYRHEASSLALVLSLDANAYQGVDMELVRHLIASHHGAARPFLPFVKDQGVALEATVDGREATVSSNHRLYRADSGVSDRFWRLTKRYGWFGLGFLEALLRLADHRVSEEEGRNG